ncbi:hypothetical protein [Kitasatospora sp. NRRL B-11411]|uniref:hypothetical protein n=1 Tax=Kitasatospora sp. NRRL B-11411 TaxID=1463822 RepID=UPI00068C2FDA|nr:hypothetical protein [Kitasatospora sp. NRRL B-11411]
MELTEQRPVPAPAVVGLLRLTTRTAARQAALAEVLAEFCAQRELDLTEIATDVDLAELTVRRGLYGIVLPSLAHLGAAPERVIRHRQLAEAGLQLLVVRGRQVRTTVASTTSRRGPHRPT